jgi:hypothetical protein
MQDVNLYVEGLSVRTSGLARASHPELRASVADAALLGEARAFLGYVLAYLRGGARLRAEETLAYGYWLTKFRPAGEGLLEAYEYSAGATEFVPGVTLALGYWRDQHEVCDRYAAEFTPPRPDQLVVISDGVLEGDAVQGVRYRSPEHMSGWWITTDRYNGDVASLRREHLYHLTAARADLARYVALPFGFRFDLAHHEDVWFDPKTLG